MAIPSDFLSQNSIEQFSNCHLCPRNCGVNRFAGEKGYCGETAVLRASRAALHFWEEPVLSGTKGSGAVFFSGCNLRCVFCQNRSIALGNDGFEISVARLADIFLDLQSQGAHNINLITGVHFIPLIRDALLLAKSKSLTIPIVYNCGGYESVSALRLLDGLIDIYLPDLKYAIPSLAIQYSHAPDYFERATEAIAEMYRQVGKPVYAEAEREINDATFTDATFTDSTEKANSLLLKKGVIVRHLILPGQIKNSKKILRYLHETFGNSILISIMNQYTPLQSSLPYLETNCPELARKVTAEEYERVLHFAEMIGIENGFIQEGETASESFIPSFHGEGILP